MESEPSPKPAKPDADLTKPTRPRRVPRPDRAAIEQALIELESMRAELDRLRGRA